MLEANDNLRRMLAAIPLTENERAAVDDGQGALGKLLGRLADIPTPRRADAATDRQPHDRNMPSDRSHHLATTVIFPRVRSPSSTRSRLTMTAGSILQLFGVDVLDADDRVGHQTSTVNTPSTSGSPPPATALALLAPTYARGLNADHDAVCNGLPLPHSSGAVEGNVDRKCSTSKCTDARTSTSQIEAAGQSGPGSRGRPALPG